MAEWRLLGALGPDSVRFHLIFNLQADVSFRRPFASCVAGASVCTTPSGHVPGGGVNARDLELKIHSGGEGPDGFFLFYFEVLSVKLEAYVIFAFSSEVLLVKCNPTADD